MKKIEAYEILQKNLEEVSHSEFEARRAVEDAATVRRLALWHWFDSGAWRRKNAQEPPFIESVRQKFGVTDDTIESLKAQLAHVRKL